MKVCIIFPQPKTGRYAGGYAEILERESKAVAHRDTEVEVLTLDGGLEVMESIFDSEFNEPWILRKVLDAEAQGFQAIIIGYSVEGALEGARQAVQVPVIGPFQVALSLAAMLSEKFSAVTMLSNHAPRLRSLARQYGSGDRLVSVRSLEMGVAEMFAERERLTARIVEESKKAISEDGAEAIILSTTGFVGIGRTIQKDLGVPVVDPFLASVKLAESLVGLDLSQSKLSFPRPKSVDAVRAGAPGKL